MSNATFPKWMIFLLAAVVAITPLAIDMYLPAMATIARELNTHIGMVQQSLSVYLVGLGSGMLLFGPLADKYGRRPLALFGLGGFCLVSFAIYFVSSIEVLITLRGLQAFIGAAATVVIPGIIRHIYQENTAKGFSYISMIIMIAPMVAPSIGGLLLLFASWRSIFLFSGIYALLVFILALRHLPEIPLNDAAKNASLLKTLTSYSIVLKHPRALPMAFSMLCCALALFSYITGISFVYITYFGVSESTFGLLFAFVISFILLGNFLNTRLVSRKGSYNLLKASTVIGIIMAVLLVICALLKANIVIFTLILAFIMPCIALISVHSDALIIINFPYNTGAATAVTGTVRYAGGALAGPILAFFYTGTALPLAGLMLAGIVGVALCLLWYRRQLKRYPIPKT